MKLAVVGAGLVSPWGRSPRDHAFFLRAGVVGPPQSPYTLADDEPLKVRYCPWLGAGGSEGLDTRLADLARDALAVAVPPEAPPPAVLFVCASRRRGAAAAGALSAMRWGGRRPRVESVFDEAGVFTALARIDKMLADQPRCTAAIVAVDSFVSLDALEAWLDRQPSPWADAAHPPSEGAAALLVTSPAFAREARLPVLGSVEHVAVFTDAASDENDDPVEARATTLQLQRLPARAPLRFVFGQVLGDTLRRSEWHRATARSASRFADACEMMNLEAEVGALGAAAGAANLVFGLAVLAHDTADLPAGPGEAFLGWAMSPDGTRGLAVVTVEGRGP